MSLPGMDVLQSFMEQKQRAPHNARELIMFSTKYSFFNVTLDDANKLLVCDFFAFYYFCFFAMFTNICFIKFEFTKIKTWD